MAAGAPRARKQQIAFYGSTPAYRGVLELHGWGDLQTELNPLSKQGEWVEMGELITDDDPRHVRGRRRARRLAPELLRRYGDIVDRISFYAPYKSEPDTWLPGDRRPQEGLAEQHVAQRRRRRRR